MTREEEYAYASAAAAIRERRQAIAQGTPCRGCYGHRHGKRCADCVCCVTDAFRKPIPD